MKKRNFSKKLAKWISFAAIALLVTQVQSIAVPIARTATDIWPICGWKCTANDVQVTKFWLADGANCTPGEVVSADIWAEFNNNTGTDRYAVVLLGDIYKDGAFESSIDYCAADTIISGISSKKLFTYSWICGAEISITDLQVLWKTASNATCASVADRQCNTFSSSKCHGPETLNVKAPLIADFKVSSPTCLDGNIDFTDNTSGGETPYSYAWNFGDGETSAAANPSHSYTGAGTYSVTLTVTDSVAVTDSQSYNITVYANPLADFSADPTSGYVPLTVNFTDQSVAGSPNGGTIGNWGWDFDNDGLLDSTDQNPGYLYDTAGNYTVKLTVADNNGCSDTELKQNYITANQTECSPGDTRSCQSGFPGVCAEGIQTCGETGFWDECAPNILPDTLTEICDNLDNNCDGSVDEDLINPTICGVGACSGNTGFETCTAGVWGNDTCNPYQGAVEETCDGSIDQDCDGAVDEGCNCTNGDTMQCGQTDIGECVFGTQICASGIWGECTGAVYSSEEICDGLDNDCDGATDEGELWADKGDSCTVGVGACQATGTYVCDGQNPCGATVCSAIAGEPMAEICDNQSDDDCDGYTDAADTDCQECIPDVFQLCQTDLFGICSAGIETCGQNGFWGECVADNAPTIEICDGLDNDCDGATDEGVILTFYEDSDSDAYGNPSVSTQACSAPQGYVSDSTDCDDSDASINPSAQEVCNGVDDNCNGQVDEGESWANKDDSCTVGVGACQAAGTYVCDGQNPCGATVCSAIAGEPASEICDNQLDDDCDGYIDTADTNCQACTPENTQSCQTNLLGICSAGIETCSQTGFWGECAQTNQPVTEICDNQLDDDCDGYIDAADTDCQITGPVCGNQNCESGETCSGCPDDCGRCPSSGSGGGSAMIIKPSIIITDEKAAYLGDDRAEVTWTTNIETTEQVVYGDNSIVVPGVPPMYGYDFVTAESDFMVKEHSVIISGLSNGIIYYFRPVADRNGSTGEVVGKEVSYLIEEGIVKGVTDVSPAPEAPPCNYLLEYIKLGGNNNPTEVRKLETFLNEFEGENLIVNGVYESADFDAVSRFQEKYTIDVLFPWKYDKATGYVYITTKKKINELYCEREFALTQQQMAEIASFGARMSGAGNVGLPEAESSAPAPAPSPEAGPETPGATDSGIPETPGAAGEETEDSSGVVKGESQEVPEGESGEQEQGQEQGQGQGQAPEQSMLEGGIGNLYSILTGNISSTLALGLLLLVIIAAIIYYYLRKERSKKDLK